MLSFNCNLIIRHHSITLWYHSNQNYFFKVNRSNRVAFLVLFQFRKIELLFGFIRKFAFYLMVVNHWYQFCNDVLYLLIITRENSYFKLQFTVTLAKQVDLLTCVTWADWEQFLCLYAMGSLTWCLMSFDNRWMVLHFIYLWLHVAVCGHLITGSVCSLGKVCMLNNLSHVLWTGQPGWEVSPW